MKHIASPRKTGTRLRSNPSADLPAALRIMRRFAGRKTVLVNVGRRDVGGPLIETKGRDPHMVTCSEAWLRA